MKRDKAWWAARTQEQRSIIVYYERQANRCYGLGGGGYLPDDCGECPICSQPVLGGGMCDSCDRRYQSALDGVVSGDG